MTNDAKALVTTLLAMLQISQDQISFEEGEVLSIDVAAGEDLKGMLIGRHAQTLDSLQLILSLMINNQQLEHQRILLDIDKYRQARLEKIIESADQIANLVAQTDQPKALPRLSPTERRQVHMHFATNEKFTTFSQGEGEGRRLFIAPASS